MSNINTPSIADSSPAKRTNFPEENDKCRSSRTDSAQNPAQSKAKVRFPKVIRYRKAEATIYGKKPNYPFYRVAYYDATHKRRMKHFGTYSEASAEADRLVREISQGSAATALSPAQARDALTALERLNALRQATGKQVSLLAAVSEYAEASAKLSDLTLGDAIQRFLNTVASISRIDVSSAVEELIQNEEPRTKLTEKGQERPQLSAKHHYNRCIILRRFASTFQNTAVCDLTKAHLDTFMQSLMKDFSAKSRNHHRGAIKGFLRWCVRKDYLSPTHRLFEAVQMDNEDANTAEVEFYTPKEFRALLEAAEGPMQAMIAIGGLAGLRTAELLRLTWEDVWREPGHIDVTRSKAKTRQRRLVEMSQDATESDKTGGKFDALLRWLEPFRAYQGKVCPITAKNAEIIWQQQFLELCDNAKVTRKQNGLRHAFCTYHYALHANEGLTAQQAGNSPSMVHSNYRGKGVTRETAKKWFSVAPAAGPNVVPMETPTAA